MVQLLDKFFSVYIFFEGAHLLTYPEPDELNSNSYTISLNFVLISYSPVVPKQNFIIVTGSCHPYPVWRTLLAQQLT